MARRDLGDHEREEENAQEHLDQEEKRHLEPRDGAQAAETPAARSITARLSR